MKHLIIIMICMCCGVFVQAQRLVLPSLNSASGTGKVDSKGSLTGKVGFIMMKTSTNGTSKLSSYVMPVYDPMTVTSSFFQKFFSVYPNPATDRIIINSGNHRPFKKVLVYDTNGQQLIAKSEHPLSIELTSLAAGIYLLKLYDGKSWFTEKIVKQE